LSTYQMQINKSQTNWEKKKIKRPDKAKHAKKWK